MHTPHEIMRACNKALIINIARHTHNAAPRDINALEACYWAYTVKQHLPHCTLIASYSKDNIEGHAFIRFEGLYYDAESLDGLLSWKELKYFQTHTSNHALQIFSVDEFAIYKNLLPPYIRLLSIYIEQILDKDGIFYMDSL